MAGNVDPEKLSIARREFFGIPERIRNIGTRKKIAVLGLGFIAAAGTAGHFLETGLNYIDTENASRLQDCLDGLEGVALNEDGTVTVDPYRLGPEARSGCEVGGLASGRLLPTFATDSTVNLDPSLIQDRIDHLIEQSGHSDTNAIAFAIVATGATAIVASRSTAS